MKPVVELARIIRLLFCKCRRKKRVIAATSGLVEVRAMNVAESISVHLVFRQRQIKAVPPVFLQDISRQLNESRARSHISSEG